MRKVSVIMTTYNRADFICLAIDSILSQTYKNLEIIIVDDGSTDETAVKIDKYRNINSTRVHIINQPNRGIAFARNRGISEACGDYIAFLDSDDLFLTNKLSKSINFLEHHPEYSMVYSDMEVIDERGCFIEGWLERKKEYSDGYIYKNLLKECFFVPSAVVARKKVFEDVGGFSEDILGVEDIDLWLRIARNHKIGLLPEPLVQWRCHCGNLSKNMPLVITNMIKVYSKQLMLPGNDPGSWLLLRQRLAEKYFDLAGINFTSGNQIRARQNFWRSFLSWPGIMSLAYCLITFLPVTFVDYLRSLRRGNK